MTEPENSLTLYTSVPWADERLIAAEVRALEARDDRDAWVRHFNRLQAAVQHHRDADRFKDDHDEALYAAMDRVLRDATKGSDHA